MKPENFPQSNRTLTAPTGRPEVQPLRVWTDGTVCLSLWRPSWRERLSIFCFGRIWLYVSGRTQPPVALTGIRDVFSAEPIAQELPSESKA